jgi:hypothetical protein
VTGRAKQRDGSDARRQNCVGIVRLCLVATVLRHLAVQQDFSSAAAVPACCSHLQANEPSPVAASCCPPPPLPPLLRLSRAAPTNLINPCGCCVFLGRAHTLCFPSVLCLLQRTSLGTAFPPGLGGCWLSRIGGRGVNVIDSFHGCSAGSLWCRSHGARQVPVPSSIPVAHTRR